MSNLGIGIIAIVSALIGGFAGYSIGYENGFTEGLRKVYEIIKENSKNKK